NITVSDDQATDESCPDTSGGLAPGAFITCTASYTVTQADLDAGSVVNIASASDDDVTTSPTDTETATATQSPALTLVKSITANATYSTVGQVIAYEFLVTNTGNVTLFNITVSDDQATDESCPDTSGGLAPGASITCTASYTVTQADLDAGSVVNIASASDDDVTTSPTDTETATATQSPALTLVKSITANATYSTVGQVIAYEFLVTNTGNITLFNITVSDDQATDESCPDTSGGLAPGASITCTASYTVTQADLDAGSVVNIASASDDDVTTSPTDTETATATQSPALTLVKSITANATYSSVGQVIAYEFLVTNTGNVTLFNITVSDDQATDESCPDTSGGLAPGAFITCTASYTVTQADLDAGSVVNIASASDDDVTTSPTDTETATATQSPALTLVKSITANATYSSVGQVIAYEFLVTNTGNITLFNITVSDDQATDESCPDTSGGLAPGASITCTASYTVTQADLDAGSVVNIASASDDDVTTSPTDTETATATQSPALTLVKSITANATYSSVGQVIAYEFLVTNTGNVTLFNITVSDDQATDESCPDTSGGLAPGASITCTASYTVTQPDIDNGSITNVAFASSQNGTTSPTYTETATEASTPLIDLSIIKGVDNSTPNVGSNVIFTITVSNAAGFSDATGVSVEDILPSGYTYVSDDSGGAYTANIWTIGDLAAGSSATLNITATVMATGPYDNYTQVETANEIDTDSEPGDNSTTDDDDDTVIVIPNSEPIIIDPAVTKSGDPELAEVGDIVVYTITVENNGNTDALNVQVIDTKPDFLDVLSVTISPDLGQTITILANIITVDIGTLSPSDFFTITITTQVNALGQPPGGTNTVEIFTSSIDSVLENNIAGSPLQIVVRSEEGFALPETGFAPGRVTQLPTQPEKLSYTSNDGMFLEIPALGVEMQIEGIPITDEGWDVTWLGENAGYLESTAFPTWAGNTGIAGHVTLPNGFPGPFANLDQLQFGDEIIIHAWGSKYTYEIRNVDEVNPNDFSILEHQEYDWITLITCKEFNDTLDIYEVRLIAQAVLISVESETSALNSDFSMSWLPLFIDNRLVRALLYTIVRF
ncbi:MAG: sortase, partial [Chloroflexi bacterium]|nr:sortase [Chloroflexota bacterium]